MHQKCFQKCAKALQKCAKNVWKSAPKKLFGKSAPKMFAKVRQKIQLWDKNENFLSPEPGAMGFYLPASCSCFQWCQTSNDQWYNQVHFYTFPWPPNKKGTPKYQPLFPMRTFISFPVKSWGSKRSKISNFKANPSIPAFDSNNAKKICKQPKYVT